ncbi:MAG: phosphate/phosphite/phosphonate ABC transporter substrate-binding protein [Nitriliruptor sp.]|uniref:phosphate/phosphite/phosphonate ABC transporter substrate-binding protein n=1 Tax=Nitriliruptor sp. TaxID=2448056 RepID=UPI0034A0790A
MKIRKWTALSAAAVLLAACGGTDDEPEDTTTETEATDDGAEETEDDGEAAAGEDWPDELVLGLVPSQDMDKLVEDASVLGELLSEELGITVTTNITDDYTALVVAMGTGQADIGMFGPIALAQSVDQSDAVPILQSVRRGAATYHTQWFTNDPDRFCDDEPVEAENAEGFTYLYCNGTDAADAGPVGEDALNNIEEGETIFFVDEASASGYYYPATQLQQVAGIDPFGTEIDPQFAGGHPNAILAVLRGDGAIGTSFDDARNVVVEDEPAVAEDIVVFAWSTEIPNDGISVSGDLPEDLVQAITDAFLALAADEEGNAALFEVYEIEDLVEVDMAAIDEARAVAENFGD